MEKCKKLLSGIWGILGNGVVSIVALFGLFPIVTFATSTDTVGIWLAENKDQFSTTTGFDIQGVIGWMSTNLVKMFAGTSVSAVYEFRYWFASLAIIGGVILFAGSALRFFKKV